MGHARRKILVITGVFPPDRIAEADHVFYLSEQLTERGFEVEVLTGKGATQATDLPFRVNRAMSNWSWIELPRLVRAARRFSPDVILLWFIGPAFNFHPMIAIAPTALKRILPDATIVTQITAPVATRPWRYSIATKLIRRAALLAVGTNDVHYGYDTLFRDSDSVIVMSSLHLRILAQDSPHLVSKAVLVPPPSLLKMTPNNASVRARGRQALGVAEDAFVFAYFGRLYRGKGLETLLEAFGAMRARHDNLKLAIVGGAVVNLFNDDWKVEQLYDQARALGIAADVVWTGEYPWDGDLGSTYLRAADVAVLPFDSGVQLNNSSFAGVAAHGLPVVTTRGPDLEDAFVDEQNVLLCAPRDPADMARAMERVLLEPDLRQRLQSGSRALTDAWFTWESSVNRTIDAFTAG